MKHSQLTLKTRPKLTSLNITTHQKLNNETVVLCFIPKLCFFFLQQRRILAHFNEYFCETFLILTCMIDHGISLQQYADDTQLHISVSTADLTVNLSTLESCLQSLHCWLCHNSLTLNSNKSDTILFGTASRMRKFYSVPSINIAGNFKNLVPLSDKIVTLEVTLALCDHISNVCRSAHFHIPYVLYVSY